MKERDRFVSIFRVSTHHAKLNIKYITLILHFIISLHRIVWRPRGVYGVQRVNIIIQNLNPRKDPVRQWFETRLDQQSRMCFSDIVSVRARRSSISQRLVFAVRRGCVADIYLPVIGLVRIRRLCWGQRGFPADSGDSSTWKGAEWKRGSLRDRCIASASANFLPFDL